MKEEQANIQVRTDLAVEARDMFVEQEEKVQKESQLKGVTVKEREQDNIKISYVEIDETGEELIGKKKGSYVTIYADGVKRQDTNRQEKAAEILAKELEELIAKDRKSTRLNSSHVAISYAVFCLKKKKRKQVRLT